MRLIQRFYDRLRSVLAGCGAGFMTLVSTRVSMANFSPRHRGFIMGVTTAFFFVGPCLFSIVYVLGFSDKPVSNFFLCLSLCVIVVNILAILFVRTPPLNPDRAGEEMCLLKTTIVQSWTRRDTRSNNWSIWCFPVHTTTLSSAHVGFILRCFGSTYVCFQYYHIHPELFIWKLGGVFIGRSTSLCGTGGIVRGAALRQNLQIHVSSDVPPNRNNSSGDCFCPVRRIRRLWLHIHYHHHCPLFERWPVLVHSSDTEKRIFWTASFLS